MISPTGQRDETLSELIAASARGNEQAFARLYRATSATLFGVALRILRRRDWAEEVLQESFVSVWRHAVRYDETKGAPMTWMIRIVRNQAFDWVHPSRPDGFEQRHGNRLDGAGDEGMIDLEALAQDGTVAFLEGEQQRDRITRCLNALEAKQRQSIVLVFFHGLSHSELAAHLRQPLGTVKAWVRRGLKRLAMCLAGNG